MDKDSRDFVIAHGDGNVVIDWYNGGREHFEACANHRAISTFPSVVVHVPPHKYQPDDYGETEDDAEAEILDIDGYQRITEKVASLEDVQEAIDGVNEILVKSEALGLDVPPLTMADLDKSDAYYQDE